MLLPQRLVALSWRWSVLLPTVSARGGLREPGAGILIAQRLAQILHGLLGLALDVRGNGDLDGHQQRSEEHTSELQSRGHLVCRLLLEKKRRFITQSCEPRY